MYSLEKCDYLPDIKTRYANPEDEQRGRYRDDEPPPKRRWRDGYGPRDDPRHRFHRGGRSKGFVNDQRHMRYREERRGGHRK